MRYFPAALSSAETDVFIARIVEYRARHEQGLEAAFCRQMARLQDLLDYYMLNLTRCSGRPVNLVGFWRPNFGGRGSRHKACGLP